MKKKVVTLLLCSILSVGFTTQFSFFANNTTPQSTTTPTEHIESFFDDNFDDDLSKWENTDNWYIESGMLYYTYIGSIPSDLPPGVEIEYPVLLATNNVANGCFNVGFVPKFIDYNFGVTSRVTDDNYYLLKLNNSNLIFSKYIDGEFTVLYNQSYSVELNKKYNLEIKASDDSFGLYVNDELVKDIKDSSIKSGTFGIWANYSSGVDNAICYPITPNPDPSEIPVTPAPSEIIPSPSPSPSLPAVDPVSSVKIDADSLVMIENGDQITFSATNQPGTADQNVTWKISNTKIAEIDQYTGKVTTKKTGIVFVTATSSNGKSDTIMLRVLS